MNQPQALWLLASLILVQVIQDVGPTYGYLTMDANVIIM